MSAGSDPPGVAGMPRILLRLEGAALLVVASVIYGWTGNSWWLFALLFLAPDLSFLGYLAGPRTGAFAYNLCHTTLTPIALGGVAFAAELPLAFALSFIWAAHVGFDRMLGYGLKYEAGFGFTHLGRIGHQTAADRGQTA